MRTRKINVVRGHTLVRLYYNFDLFQYYAGGGMEHVPRMDSINSGMTDGTHLSLQPQMDVTFASQTTRTARKINTSEYQVYLIQEVFKSYVIDPFDNSLLTCLLILYILMNF